jgi:hypothetical protein
MRGVFEILRDSESASVGLMASIDQYGALEEELRVRGVALETPFEVDGSVLELWDGESL